MLLMTIASMPTSNEQTTKFPAHSALLKQKLKACGGRVWTKIILQVKLNKQALVLKFAPVTSTPRASAAVQLKFLVSQRSQMNFVVSEKLLVSKNAFSWSFLLLKNFNFTSLKLYV